MRSITILTSAERFSTRVIRRASASRSCLAKRSSSESSFVSAISHQVQESSFESAIGYRESSSDSATSPRESSFTRNHALSGITFRITHPKFIVGSAVLKIWSRLLGRLKPFKGFTDSLGASVLRHRICCASSDARIYLHRMRNAVHAKARRPPSTRPRPPPHPSNRDLPHRPRGPRTEPAPPLPPPHCPFAS